ncbi:hypothetical protein DWF00_11380 [Bosea caraganae]|uniref:Uncharacterized protein n=1 Tax=Bosea caraganae TaxID=2763117 RepID=A0A370LC60_9HYPH|nr:DUF6516 family protein [Bosea caraganae]RDJ27539.1 hypothetical protein DWF00_11380 [Bosea caraganae]RDJ29554.1 hypothetical protein DWE98_03150 [Bosea caraganae]
MKAALLISRRIVLAEDAFAELKVWHVPTSVPASAHGYKYRLAYVVRDECLLRYDNERGKGDHKHVGEVEQPYSFSTIETLIDDFFRDIEGLRP